MTGESDKVVHAVGADRGGQSRFRIGVSLLGVGVGVLVALVFLPGCASWFIPPRARPVIDAFKSFATALPGVADVTEGHYVGAGGLSAYRAEELTVTMTPGSDASAATSAAASLAGWLAEPGREFGIEPELRFDTGTVSVDEDQTANTARIAVAVAGLGALRSPDTGSPARHCRRALTPATSRCKPCPARRRQGSPPAWRALPSSPNSGTSR